MVDNDGDSDLFITASGRDGQFNLFFMNDGGGSFRQTTRGSLVNEGARNLLYENNGEGTFTRITTGAIVSELGGVLPQNKM